MSREEEGERGSVVYRKQVWLKKLLDTGALFHVKHYMFKHIRFFINAGFASCVALCDLIVWQKKKYNLTRRLDY